MSTAASLFEESAGTGSEAAAGGAKDAAATKADGQQAAPDGKGKAGASASEKAGDEGQYEADWLRRFADGKYHREEDARRGYEEFGRLVREKSEALTKAEERWKGVEGLVGAPVNEKGEPADYQLKLPDGAEFDPQLLKQFTEFGRKKNLSNAALQEALDDIVVPWQVGMELGAREAEKARLVEALGGEESAGKALGELFDWGSEMLGGDAKAVELLREAGSSAASILMLMALRARIQERRMGRNVGAGATIDEAEYRQLLQKQIKGQNLTPAETQQLSDFAASKSTPEREE